ncbi:MAG TPA: alpha/beta hydrolase [Casimicrobiaceae bacterium]|nr:alpha/beta hydrolase [Casimicrobiaceae bacterium]
MQTQVAVKPATSHFVDVRGARHHVQTWGEPSSPPLVLLHGWMDVGASFQFLVDALSRDWYAIAPDLRGFGRSAWQPQGYWFYDYFADLEALLTHFVPDEPARLVGHSLGGNIAMGYAGVRPGRVRCVVSLEGFGIPAESADAAPRKAAAWLAAVANPPGFRTYANLDAVADRLQKKNARLPRDKADFLARHWAAAFPDGRAKLVSDPRHKLPFPHVYRMDEILAMWRQISAPVLWVAAEDSEIPRWLAAHPEGEAGADGLDEVRKRIAHVPGARLVTVSDAGHMLHHDQSEQVAKLIEPFLAPA